MHLKYPVRYWAGAGSELKCITDLCRFRIGFSTSTRAAFRAVNGMKRALQRAITSRVLMKIQVGLGTELPGCHGYRIAFSLRIAGAIHGHRYE